MKVYFIEVGVLIKNHEEEFEKYNIVYDHLYGYYDEDQYWSKDINEAKREVVKYVSRGIEGTYGLIKEYDIEPFQGWRKMKVPDYDVDNIIFSVRKEHNLFDYDFIDTHINSLYEAYKKDWLKQRNININIEDIDEETGINGEIYACFDEFINNEYLDNEFLDYLYKNYEI